MSLCHYLEEFSQLTFKRSIPSLLIFPALPILKVNMYVWQVQGSFTTARQVNVALLQAAKLKVSDIRKSDH